MARYKRTLRFEDFGFAGDQALTIAVWNRIGVFTCPAQCKYYMGGDYDAYAYVILVDASDVTRYGKVRIQVSDALENRKQTVLEFNTRITTSASDKANKIVNPLKKPGIHQDSKFILEVMPETVMDDVAGNYLDFGKTLAAIDVTVVS